MLFTTERKKLFLALFSILLVLSFYVAIDPDFGFIKNLPFGGGAIIALQYIITTAAIILVIEVIPDLMLDKSADRESALIRVAMGSPQGAGLIFLGRSIRVIAYAIVANAVLG